MNKPMTLLQQVQDLIDYFSDPTRHTKGAMARAPSLEPGEMQRVLVNDPAATCHCLVGAATRHLPLPPSSSGCISANSAAYNTFNTTDLAELLSACVSGYPAVYMADRPADRIVAFNDSVKTRHADVMEVLAVAKIHAQEAGV